MPQEFPPISAQLIQKLDSIFSDSLPKKDDYSDRDVAISVGTRKVIDRLRMEYNRQQGLPLVQPVE